MVLIPKKVRELEVKDFWSISLVGNIYKILMKLFANKLKGFCGGIVSDTENVFIEDK